MPWAPAQLGLDGVPYAVPAAEPESQVAPNGVVVDPARQLWLAEVEEHTLPFRTEVAGRHRNRAAAASEAGKASTAHWHEQRAEGAMKRFEKVGQCGSRGIRRTFACGHGEASHAVCRCSDWKSCPHCRGHRQSRYRARIRGGRLRQVRRYQFARRGGRWTEKLMTLTLPHVGTVDERVHDMNRAHPKLRRMLLDHLELDRNVPRNMRAFPFVRAFEMTVGYDACGHPHLHVWMLSPYIPHELIRLYWARALGPKYADHIPTRPLAEVLDDVKGARSSAELAQWLVTRRGPNGRELEEVPWPVVDIRAAHDVERELVKYLVKDFERAPDGSRRYIEPAAFAMIYSALSRCRSISTSRGFYLPPRAPPWCRECGCMSTHTEMFDRAEVGLAVGHGLAALAAFASTAS